MIDLKIRFNASALIKKIEEWSRSLPNAVADELETTCNEILETDIRPNRIPRKTGALAASAKVEKQPAGKNESRVRISVGEGLDYAVEVHEDTTRYHPHGQAKYLTGPMQEQREKVKQAILRGLSVTFSGKK